MSSEINSRLLIVSLVLVCSLINCTITSETVPICQPGLEYWSEINSTCKPCTKCAPKITITPCAIHKDAICDLLSSQLHRPFFDNSDEIKNYELWKFSQMGISPEVLRQFNDNYENSLEFDGGTDNIFQSQEFQMSMDTDESGDINCTNNFSNKLSWDWQTSALVLAVCACIIFFLVAGCSAIIYVRQWRRMKRNFEPAGLEEISVRLNLMVKAELAELTTGAPMNPGDPETRCQYLEKLLDRKRETPTVVTDNGWPETGGNLYIEEGAKTTRCKRAQIARIHQNIESILSHKPTMNRQ